MYKTLGIKFKATPACPAWLLLGSFYLISLMAFWPGVVSPDAKNQYAAAISGVYTDHHPPLMSFVWRYLAKIYPGPGPMLLLHLSMLYLAAAIFIYIFRNSKFKWWYAVYPIIPNMLAYTSLIVKDAGFTYCYLLAGAILALLMVQRDNRYKSLLLITTIILLFYGTAVKFQAQYLLVFFTIGIVYCLENYKLNWRTLVRGVGLNFAILLAIMWVNAYLVPKTQKSNSWQLVKLYDLSALSVALNKPLYPGFVLKQANFNFEKIKQQFNAQEVDPLVFPKDSLLKGSNDPYLQTQLLKYWWEMLQEHPLTYLKIRLKLFSYNLTTAPSERTNPIEFLNTTAMQPLLQNTFIQNLLNAGYSGFKIALRFIWLIPFLILHCYIALSRFKVTVEAAPLLMFSMTTLALLLILLFFSMAGTARYVFLGTCLIHASHGFAYRAWEGKKSL